MAEDTSLELFVYMSLLSGFSFPLFGFISVWFSACHFSSCLNADVDRRNLLHPLHQTVCPLPFALVRTIEAGPLGFSVIGYNKNKIRQKHKMIMIIKIKRVFMCHKK